MHRGRTHTMEMDEMEEAERTTWTDVDDPVEDKNACRGGRRQLIRAPAGEVV